MIAAADPSSHPWGACQLSDSEEYNIEEDLTFGTSPKRKGKPGQEESPIEDFPWRIFDGMDIFCQ